MVKNKPEASTLMLAQQGIALSYSEASMFDRLLEAIPDMVWVKDLEGKYIQCNRLFERCLGLNKADILGNDDQDFWAQNQPTFIEVMI